MNLRSISFRLVAWYTGLLAVLFLLLGMLLYTNLRHFLENDVRQSEARRTHQIASALLAHVETLGETNVVAQTREWFAPEMNNRFIRITRLDGSLVYRAGVPKDGSYNPAEVPVPVVHGAAEYSRKYRLAGGQLLLVQTLVYQKDLRAGYVVEFGELLDPVESMLRHLFLQLAFGLPLAVIIIAGGGYYLLRRALTPVGQITQAAETITQHNLSERLPVARTDDELAALAMSLNRMIARLDEAFQNSKRFVADASHDLRTPLTILRGELETLSEDRRLEPEVRGRIESMLEEAVHLSKIVEQLFTLSRLDAGEARTEWTKFDLAELARSTTEQMNLLAEDKGILVTCQAEQSLMVEGDRVRLKQVIVNLLDNAIKYSRAAGTVQVRVHGVNGHAELEVVDDGIGIPAEALPHVFERFYRVDQVRASSAESAGLGLSIVKSICTAHQAEVEAASSLGVGSCFRVKLPVCKSN